MTNRLNESIVVTYFIFKRKSQVAAVGMKNKKQINPTS